MFLYQRMTVGDGLQRFRRIQRGALGKFDQDVDRVVRALREALIGPT